MQRRKMKGFEISKGKYKIVKQESVEDQIKGMTAEEANNYRKLLEQKKNRVVNRIVSLKTAKFIGKYHEFIKKELEEDLKRLDGTTMMVHEERALGPASTRGTHIYNTAEIAYAIAMGILGDEEIADGIALAALLHDIGQPSFGHGGENISTGVSEKKYGGPRPHNATGGSRILFRDSRKIVQGIRKGIGVDVVKEEASRRGISVDELKTRLNQGKETELENRIVEKVQGLSTYINKSVETLAMAAGRHNGERGTATIIPNYNTTFNDFFEVLEKCYIYKDADKEMQSGNMIDAIVKISDQISSIPYDMIDGKKGGLVVDIPESYAQPVSKILDISEEEAKKRLKGNNKELDALVIDIQTKLIDSLIKSSNYKIIKMDKESLMYGKKDKTGKTLVLGLRMLTYSEYLPYTTSETEEKYLQDAWYKCTDILSREILDSRGIFDPELNAVFRMDLEDPRRKVYEESLQEQYMGDERFKDFYEYIIQTSPEEYKFIKANLTEYGKNLLKEKITSAKKQYLVNTGKYTDNNDDELEQGILNYIIVAHEGIPEPANGNEYTDEEITRIHNKINYKRRIQGRRPILLQKDERIAAQMALGYLEYRFHDGSFVDFSVDIGAMTPEQAKEIRRKYNPVARVAHISGSLKKASKEYEEAEMEGEEIEI